MPRRPRPAENGTAIQNQIEIRDANPIENSPPLETNNTQELKRTDETNNTQNIINAEGPLPNPFDPKKIDEINERTDKESGQEQENNDDQTEKEMMPPTDNINPTPNPDDTTPKVVPLQNNAEIVMP